MTRTEFDREFAAMAATHGYNGHTINILNDRVFEATKHIDLDADGNAKSVIDEAFRRAYMVLDA